jgi:hypothetical protein
MRFLISSALLTLCLLSCVNRKSSHQATESTETLDSLGNVFYRNDGQSYLFIKHDGDTTKCYDIQSVDYRIQQLAPAGEWGNYVIKETSITKTCDGQEGQKRSIKAEISPVEHPDEIFFVLQHDADELNLEHDYYHTVVYGCCDEEPIHKVYDYDGNLLIRGNSKLLIGAVPNNLLKFYVGYTPSKEDSVIGTVHLVYNADEKYDIRIQSPPLPPEFCSQYAPSMSIVSTLGGDTLEVYQNEYQLWDLEQIQSTDQFNHLVIKVVYYCELYYPVEPIIIPIYNGKPFGKDSLVQHVRLPQGEGVP